jgi:hypothetical protein
MWSSYVSKKIHQGKQNNVDDSREGRSLDWYNASLVGIERQARSHWLALLIEWDRRDSVGKLLKGIKSNPYINKTSLNNALQVALEHDRFVTNESQFFKLQVVLSKCNVGALIRFN